MKYRFLLDPRLHGDDRKTTKLGFTLIELLVVIAIIGILTGISIFSLMGSRESARDVRRKADLEQIKSALEIYRSDCGRYPTVAQLSFGSALNGDGTNCPSTNNYMQKVPQDTVTGRNYGYKVSGSPPSAYTICAALEDVTTVDAATSTACSTLSCGATCTYYVKSN